MATSDLQPNVTDPTDETLLTYVDVAIAGADASIVSDISWVQLVLAESILTPGLQTALKVQNNSNFLGGKNFDSIKVLNEPIFFKPTRLLHHLLRIINLKIQQQSLILLK